MGIMAEEREEIQLENLWRPRRETWTTPHPMPLITPKARHVQRKGFVQPRGEDRRFISEDAWGERRPEWHWGAYVRHMRRMRNAAAVLAMKASLAAWRSRSWV